MIKSLGSSHKEQRIQEQLDIGNGQILKNALSEAVPREQMERIASGRKKHLERYRHTGHSFIVDPLTRDAFLVTPDNNIIRKFTTSTGRNGLSTNPAAGSNTTPIGTMRIVEKKGDNTPPGEKVPGMIVWTRSFTLEGLEPGITNSRARGILMHGVNPTKNGQLKNKVDGLSSGCVVLDNQDVIELYNVLPVGSLLEVLPKQQSAIA